MRAPGSLIACSVMAWAAACGSGGASDSAASPNDSDASSADQIDASTNDSHEDRDSSSEAGGTDGAPSDSALDSSSDAPDFDAAPLPPIVCAAPETVAGGLGEATSVAARVLVGGKTLVAWNQSRWGGYDVKVALSSDWSAVQSFIDGPANRIVVREDGAGGASLLWDHNTVTFAASIDKSSTLGPTKNYYSTSGKIEATGLLTAAGGAVAAFRVNGSLSTVSNVGGTWGQPSAPLASGVFDVALATNGSGQSALLWTSTNADGHRADAFVATSNGGGTWSALAPHTVGSGGNTFASVFDVGVLANGDPIVGWTEGGNGTTRTYVERYQLGTATWTSPELVLDMLGVGGSQVFVDAADRLTVVGAKLSDQHAMVVRNLGAGWSATPAELNTPTLEENGIVFDRATGALATIVRVGANLGVARIAGGQTTADTPVPTQFPNQWDIPYALAFDGVHARVFAIEPDGSGKKVVVSNCE